MSRQAARAIIIRNNHLLVMHRNKFGHEYNTLPGGNVEMGETLELAVIREVSEETSLTVESLKLVFVEEAGDPYGTQYIFKGEVATDGEPRLSTTSEEAQINKLGKNLYEPKWLPLDAVASEEFLSEKLKLAILSAIENGFPSSPQQIS